VIVQQIVISRGIAVASRARQEGFDTADLQEARALLEELA
jgi:hypothetical protein